MNKDKRKNSQIDLLIAGFALLFPGILLGSILDVNITFQIIGLVMIIVSSVFFGASISKNIRGSRKK